MILNYNRINAKKGGIAIKKNTGKKENKEYQELKRIVSTSRNSAAMKQLDLLFEETNWAFEPYDLVELVKSFQNEQALEELVALMGTKHAMRNHLSSLLKDIIESKISSEKGKLKETSKMIQKAIHNEFWKLPS